VKTFLLRNSLNALGYPRGAQKRGNKTSNRWKHGWKIYLWFNNSHGYKIEDLAARTTAIAVSKDMI